MPLDHARTITQVEYDAIWQEASECGEVAWKWNGIECWQSIPQRLGKGEKRVIRLQPGLTLYIYTSWYVRSLQLNYHSTTKDKLLSNFYLLGGHRTINPGIQLEDDREETAGETCLCHIAEAQSIEYYPAEQPHKNLGIAIDFERLRSFGFAQEDAPPPLRQLAQGKAVDSFHQSLNHTTPMMQQILQLLLDCPYRGAVKRMYLESKVLELLALQFHHLSKVQRSDLVSPKLRSGDIERLQLARDILRQKFNDPPSLLELARQVGLNDYKLKRGFRQVFDTTVFGYVHACRMEQAQHLLCDRGLRIADVAERVGYASPSRFCHAFKRHTDLTPSDYRRQFKA
ncbi:AraC family transcriptional regulator [Leptothoe sp. EHU-05/26/07-4]